MTTEQTHSVLVGDDVGGHLASSSALPLCSAVLNGVECEREHGHQPPHSDGDLTVWLSVGKEQHPTDRIVMCADGPLTGLGMPCPLDATPGTACALGWQTARKVEKYAVYVLREANGVYWLAFSKSYDTPQRAATAVTKHADRTQAVMA